MFSLVQRSASDAQSAMKEMMALVNRMLKKSFPTVDIQVSINTQPIKLQNTPEQSVEALMHPINSL
jgi:hypothetical protein